MDVSLQKELAAKILGVGKDRIWIDPKKLDEVSKALTREDVRRLIDEGKIRVKEIKGQSRYWSVLLHKKRKEGRRRGHGSRKGKKSARIDEKRQHILKVRAMRKLIRTLRMKNVIDIKTYRQLYGLIKGGTFRNKKHILLWLKEKGILR